MQRTPPAGRPGERGQASVEHAAVVAVVLVVLAAAVAVAAGLSGAGIVNAVHSGVRRAICVAGGDDCADFHVQRPCAVAVDRDATSQGVKLGIWRLGRDRSLAIERRSDGSVVVTAFDDVEGGVGLSVGARFGIGRSGVHEDDDGPLSATAGVEARLRGGWGRTWEFPDAAAATAFVRRFAAKESVRDPDVERVRIGVDATISGEVSGPLGVSASGSLLTGLHGEGTRDRRTGETTVSLALPRSAAVDAAGPLGLQLGGSLELEPSATLITDGRLRARELRLVGTLTTRDGTRRRDVQLRVDLTRPQVAAGLRGMLHGLADADPARARAAAVDLGRWAADEGWIDQREYAGSSTTDGFDGEIGLGLGLGLHDQDTHSSSRLMRARSRPPGGLWEDRTDCVAGTA